MVLDKQLPVKSVPLRLLLKSNLNNTKCFGAIFGILAAIALYFIIPYGAPNQLAEAVPHSFLPIAVIPKITGALSIWLLVYLIFRPIESGHSALIFMAALLIIGYPSKSIFTMLTINPGWFQISSFIIAVAMMRSGLAKRLAFLMMHKLGANTVPKFLFASVIMTLVLILLIPSGTSMIALLMPIMIYVADEWNLPARSQSKGLPVLGVCAMFLCVMAGLSSFWVKTGTSQSMIALSIAKIDIEWFLWFKIAGITIALSAMFAVLLLILILRPSREIRSDMESLKKKAAHLGQLTKVERNVLIVMFFVLCFWVTESFHHISPGWIALCAVIIYSFPKFNLFQDFNDAISTINWPLLFFETALLAMAGVISTSGITAMIGNLFANLQPESIFGYYVLSSLIGGFITPFVSLSVMQAVVVPLFISWGNALGLPEAQSFLAVWIPIGIAGNLLPSLLPSVLFAWTFKYKGETMFTFKDGAIVGLIVLFAYFIVGTIGQLTFWNVM